MKKRKLILLTALAIGTVAFTGHKNAIADETYEENFLRTWTYISDVDKDDFITEYDVVYNNPTGYKRYAVKAFEYDFNHESYTAFHTVDGKTFVYKDVFNNVKNGGKYMILLNRENELVEVAKGKFNFVNNNFKEMNIRNHSNFLEIMNNEY